METQKVDIMEVILKEELQIPLTIEEQSSFKTIDEESKEMIRDLLNDNSYKEEILKIYDNILTKIQLMDICDKDLYIARCKDKIANLENPVDIDDNIAKIYK